MITMKSAPLPQTAPLAAFVERAFDAWERAGRPGAAAQLRLGAPVCSVCLDDGCEFCAQVRP